MIKQARFNKKQQVVNELVRQIESGLMEDGYVLPGEEQLAEELGVSRSTLHKALMELERRKYIARRTAGGSVVTFDGIPLDQKKGWAQALASTGARIHTEQLKLEAVERPDLNLQFGLSHFIVLERRRRRSDGTAISLERSFIPAIGGLEGLPGVGMIDDSLTITLAAYGFIGDHGDQWIGAEPLNEDDAYLLGRPAGTVFLKTLRTTYDRHGRLMEHVESWLDPTHFRMHHSFGASNEIE